MLTPSRSRLRRAAAALVAISALAASPAHADLSDLMARLFQSGPLMTFEINNSRQQLKGRIGGTVVFNAAEDDVESLTGKVMLQERRDFKTRRLVLEPDGASIKRTFSIDGKTLPYDAEARRWLAEIIPVVLRETAMNSDLRARRIHARGGADAVIAEIERIQSGYARARYITSLVPLGVMNETQLARLLTASRGIESDYERRTALVAIIEGQPASVASQSAVLAAVAGMGSDYEKRSVMVALAPRLVPDPAVAKAWQQAMARIGSDFESRTVIETLARNDSMLPGQLDVAIQSTLALGSDFEHAVALKSLLKHMDAASPATLNAFLKSAQRIGSDFERKNVLIATIETVKLDKAGYAAVLQAISGMGSDFEIGNVLSVMARRMPADAELVASYRRVARRLGDHERGQAERALDRLNM
jgi:hypothetical protein